MAKYEQKQSKNQFHDLNEIEMPAVNRDSLKVTSDVMRKICDELKEGETKTYTQYQDVLKWNTKLQAAAIEGIKYILNTGAGKRIDSEGDIDLGEEFDDETCSRFIELAQQNKAAFKRNLPEIKNSAIEVIDSILDVLKDNKFFTYYTLSYTRINPYIENIEKIAKVFNLDSKELKSSHKRVKNVYQTIDLIIDGLDRNNSPINAKKLADVFGITGQELKRNKSLTKHAIDKASDILEDDHYYSADDSKILAELFGFELEDSNKITTEIDVKRFDDGNIYELSDDDLDSWNEDVNLSDDEILSSAAGLETEEENEEEIVDDHAYEDDVYYDPLEECDTHDPDGWKEFDDIEWWEDYDPDDDQ